jgi:Asp-tRNA(Asn)/Glu-tRNA(Gln) amidotransferase A subunit family amidase
MRIDGTRWREQLRSQMYELIGEHGVAICPIFPMSAPRHGWTLRWLAMLTTSSYTTWVNLAGLPALAVPVGCSTRRGLPVGVQVVGMPGTEHAVLAAGLAIQQVCMPQWNGPDI